MLPYILTFVVSTYFTYLVQKELEKEKKIKFKIVLYSVIALILPIFYAGAREIDVGRDIRIYVLPALKWASTRNFTSYMSIPYISNIESGYTILAYIFAKISNNLTLFLSILQVFPCVSVFYFAYKKRKTIPMWLVMLTYLLTWYCRSYTIMRQSIAVAFILISIVKFEEKKYMQTILLYILAILFHTSAVVALAIYVVIWINNNLKSRDKIIVYIVIFSVIIIMSFFYKNILYYLTYSIELLPEKFYNYTLNEDYYLNELNVSFADTAFRVIILVMGFFLLRITSEEKTKKESLQYYLFMIMELVIYIISFKMTNATRLGYYFYYPSLLFLFPAFINIFKKDNMNRLVAHFLVVTILFVFWFYNYPIKKLCETYPYYMELHKEV